jgi:hypothetical protein
MSNTSRYLVLAISVFLGHGEAYAQWRQWGGTDRSFKVDKGDLDLDWSGEGEPTLVWEKEIGPGQSSVLIDRSRGFVHFRQGQEEVVLAVDLLTGTTLWQTSYAAPIPEGYPAPQELGPRATPVINNTRLFTLGSLGHVYSFDVANGNIFWSFDPVREFELTPPKAGYAAPPIIFKDRIIYALGSEGAAKTAGLVVFHQPTGTFLWRQKNLEPIEAPPVILQIDGKEHLLLATQSAILGIDPYMGGELWKFEHTLPFTPRWVPYQSTLVIPSSSPAGSAAISVKADGSGYDVKPVWKDPELQMEQSLLLSDALYAAGSVKGKPGVFRVEVDDGKVTWKDESFARGYIMYVNGHLLILDRQGTLALASETGDGLVVHAKAKIEPKGQWAAPSLDTARLYLRDNARMLSFNLNAVQYPIDTSKKDQKRPKVERESK